jgi:hypothetical protein
MQSRRELIDEQFGDCRASSRHEHEFPQTPPPLLLAGVLDHGAERLDGTWQLGSKSALLVGDAERNSRAGLIIAQVLWFACLVTTVVGCPVS